jgi:hypothetical protein
MAISATTAMTTSSLHPMSNMKNSAGARRFYPTIKHELDRPRLLPALPQDCLQNCLQVCRKSLGSDSPLLRQLLA